MPDTNKLDARWKRYLIQGLNPFTRNLFFMKELSELKNEVQEQKKNRLRDGQPERTILSSIAIDLWMHKLIDWKVPEYYQLFFASYIDTGELTYDLIESPIFLIIGRNGLILPKDMSASRYVNDHSKQKSVWDTSVYIQINKGTRRKDIKRFLEIYFDFIEANNYVIMQDKVGVRDKHSDLIALEIIFKCLDKGITDNNEIAVVLDEEYSKKGDKEWTADAVRQRLKDIEEKHLNNPYARADYLDWLTDQENR